MKSFTNDLFPNCHINFNNKGLEMVISLNIEKEMIPYLPEIRVFRSKKFYTYVVRSLIEEINITSVKGCYEFLLKKAMVDCREAKMKVLEKQINNLK